MRAFGQTSRILSLTTSAYSILRKFDLLNELMEVSSADRVWPSFEAGTGVARTPGGVGGGGEAGVVMTVPTIGSK